MDSAKEEVMEISCGMHMLVAVVGTVVVTKVGWGTVLPPIPPPLSDWKVANRVGSGATAKTVGL